MTAKEKVRAVHRHAYHKRYHTNGGEGYTLIWGEFSEKHRLGEGKTTDQAWRDAAKNVERSQPKPPPPSLFSLRPRPGDEWEFQLPEQRKKVKIVGSIHRTWVGRTAEGRDKRRMTVSWKRLNKGRYSGIFVKALIKYGRRLSTKLERDAAVDERLRKKGIEL